MKVEKIPPAVTRERTGAADEHEVFRHPAFGLITLTCGQSSRNEKLFGSDVGHMSSLRIQIHSAELHRDLSHDWIHSDGPALIEFEMTHTQFAEFITSVGQGAGTPVTLITARQGPPERVAEIGTISTKQDMLRREIRDAIRSHLTALGDETKRLEALVENGKLSKKELRDIVSNLKRHVAQAPGSLDFVIRSAEETLEAATASAKNEVNAFVAATARNLGLESLSDLSGTLKPRSLPAAGDSED